ncbi:MAG: FprA family A-type flavoprotein [Bacteroidales bacterium]|jgi:flavorubredoxin|nr:FprA family A-type flavoprotein [Bacteroidales bacterium]MCK9498841.1 FprA family A-type flavoprotein [Bacteroidales bacterium]MDY0315646.1 FprA family A-type flavoprotein [Bacteroidales bacterium]NLB85861.1 FprA family A-type flavoprotein [Bacteroidales bacterium]
MARKFKENLSVLSVVDWNRRLFDSLIPLPDGTSYNAYFIEASEKNVLIDTAEPELAQVFFEKLKGIEKIDYIVSLHAEQDHSGLIPEVLAKYPNAKLICSPKAKDILSEHLPIAEEKFITVEDGEEISLGNKTLKFIHFPWVHWPETMLAYLKEDKLMFTCDFLGSHLATTDLFVTDECLVYEAAKRYFAEIMLPFKNIINKNFPKLDEYEIDIVAPSHGPMYDKPKFIIDAYKDWLSDTPKNVVIIPYISMHGSVEKMVNHLITALENRGVKAYKFDLSVTDIGKLAITLVDAATIVIGTPTVLGEAHPVVSYATLLANALKPKAKYASVIASYAWGGKAIEKIAGMIPNIKAEIIEPIYVKGVPKEADLKAIENLAEEISIRHKKDNLSL